MQRNIAKRKHLGGKSSADVHRKNGKVPPSHNCWASLAPSGSTSHCSGWRGRPQICSNPLTTATQPRALAIRPPNVTLIEANRYDDLVATAVRADQRVEDLEEELRRLRQQHADVVKPDARLWWAVAILTAYAIAGVAVPLWVMSYGPTSLSAVRWTFWPFAAGLAALIAYIAWYLLGLTRRRRQWAADVASAPGSTATP
jgi:hypothetical protein